MKHSINFYFRPAQKGKVIVYLRLRIAAGESLAAIQQTVGHASASQTQAYLRQNEAKALREAVEALNKLAK